MVKKLNMLLSNQITRNLLVGSFSIAGIILVAYGTVWGAALTDDSYHYISSARNFLIGRGFDLTSHFAPVLPLVLSFIGLFNIDPLVAVRWFNAMLFGVNIFLIASLVHSMTHSAVFSILAALIASILSTLIVVHSWAMTEALYQF